MSFGSPGSPAGAVTRLACGAVYLALVGVIFLGEDPRMRTGALIVVGVIVLATAYVQQADKGGRR